MKYKHWIWLLLLFATACGGEKNEVNKNPTVTFITSMGKFSLELYPDKAPISVENFLNYVNEGFYNNTIFHRVVPNFVIQGGGFSPTMKNKPPSNEPIQNEANNGLSNDLGTIAMARTSNPHSATSQFFINLKHNLVLNHRSTQGNNWGYAVFGQVIRGLDVVQKIGRVATTSKSMHRDVPVEEVVLEKVIVEEVAMQPRTAIKTYIHAKLTAILGKAKTEG